MIISIMSTIGALQRRASTAASIITENLQLWLGFTSSSWVGGELVVLDKSTNTNNAKLFTGKALSFDGVNDEVSINSYALSGEFTTTIWLNTNSSGDNSLFGVNHSSCIRVRPNTATPTIELRIGSVFAFYVNAFANTWSRLVITRDSNNDITCYLNGVKSKSGLLDNTTPSSTGVFNSSSTFNIDSLGITQSGWEYTGFAADFQIYNTAWDSDDVAYDYANPNNLAIDNPNATITKSNLIGYWALSEGSGSIAYDSSGEGNSGNVYDGSILGATYVDKQPTIPQLGMMDWSKSMLFSFSNIGDYISLGTGYDYGSAATISMLVSADTLTSRYEGIFGSKFNTNGEFIILKQGTTSLLVGVNTCYVIIPNVLVNNIMQFISVVYDPSESGNDRIKVYVDGGSALTAAITGTVSGNLRNDANNLKIGSPYTYAPVSGYIGEVSVFSTAMDSTEISELYSGGAIKNATTHSESASLEGYWKNDGLSTWVDLSTNSNNGTVVGSPETMTLIQNPNDIGKDVLGNSLRLREGGFNLDGSGYAEVADSTSLNITTAITLSAWVRFKEGQYASIISKTSSTNGFQWYVGTQTIKQKFYIGSASSTGSTNFIPLDTWAYVSVVYNGTSIQYYLDGQPDGSQALVTSIPTNALDLFIGQNNFGSESFKGIVDDVLIYNDALTATEILNNYNVGLSTHS